MFSGCPQKKFRSIEPLTSKQCHIYWTWAVALVWSWKTMAILYKVTLCLCVCVFVCHKTWHLLISWPPGHLGGWKFLEMSISPSQTSSKYHNPLGLPWRPLVRPPPLQHPSITNFSFPGPTKMLHPNMEFSCTQELLKRIISLAIWKLRDLFYFMCTQKNFLKITIRTHKVR